MQYKDKFIEKNVFQWECQAGESENKIKQLLTIKKVMLFVRKTESENGLTLPFTYVGTGELTNPRQTDNKKGSLLFDIMMDNELPDYLQYDFGLTK